MKKTERKRKDTKKTEQKTDKNIFINGICLLLGVLILVFGIVAPKTIMAMMDKGELNKLYVRDVDTDLQTDNEPLSVEEKLELLCEDDANVSVSTSGQVSEDRAFNGKIIKMAEAEIKTLQEKNIIPDVDLGVYDEKSGGYYQIYNGNEVFISYSCECFSVVSLDDMNRYVSVAMLQYYMLDKYLSLIIDTDTGKIYELIIETSVSEEELGLYTQDDVETAVREYLGISEKEFASYYYVNMGQAATDGEDVYFDMSMGLNKSEQIVTSVGF